MALRRSKKIDPLQVKLQAKVDAMNAQEMKLQAWERRASELQKRTGHHFIPTKSGGFVSISNPRVRYPPLKK